MSCGKKVGIGLLLGALFLGTVATVAFAQGARGELGRSDIRIGDGDDWGPPGLRGGRGLGDMDTMHAAIADALGISVDALEEALAEGKTIVDLADELGVEIEVVRDAMQAAHDEALTKAVADGLMTQEQADGLRERMGQLAFDAYYFPRARPEGLEWPDRDGLHRENVDAAIADALGLTVDELQEAREDGKTLAELAETAGVSLDEVLDAMRAARADAIQQAVEDGQLTQEQADRFQNRTFPFGERGSWPEAPWSECGGLRGPRVRPK